LNLREKIISLLQQADYVPLGKASLASSLELNKKDRRKLDYEMRLLLSKGDVVRIQGDRFCIPKDVDLVTGTIKFRQKGSAILIPDKNQGNPDSKPVHINAEDTAVAMHDDKVVARLYDRPPEQPAWKRHRLRGPDRREGEGPYGRVIRIQSRARDTIVGTLCKTRLFYYVAPDDPRIVQDIYVPAPEESGLDPAPTVGSKVVAKLHEWEQRHVNPEGEIVKNLGQTHEPQAELMAILHKYELDLEFPSAAQKEADKAPSKVTTSQLEGRRDLRKSFTFTIDPDDAKDFDDALSLDYPNERSTRVGIHIADVAAYVKSGSALDKEALRRGNSTYLVGIVIPMLPRSLSNGICSLVEDEDRLTKSVFVTFENKSGKVLEIDYANTVIRSAKRLTYKQAHALLKGDSLQAARDLALPPAHQTGSTGRALSSLSDAELGKLQQGIRQLWAFAKKLRADRFEKGSLNLDMEETKIFVDEQGYADRLEKVQNDESHQLIEEYMLLANQCVAQEMKRKRLPAIYRVHDDPDEEKLNELRQYMATWGIQTSDLNNRKDLVKLLKTLSDHPQSRLLRTQVLRSLKKACYKSTPDGHYGLAKNDYLHFTSPIRRYSDLVVHRVFNHFLVKYRGQAPLPGETARYTSAKAASIAEYLSQTEVNSVDAERESIKVKLLEFFERELDKKQPGSFDAIITEVRNHGMFIELVESNAFGMVRLSALRDDLYRLNASATALVGRRKQNSYSLGQHIQVKVQKVDRFKRQVDFQLADKQGKARPASRSLPAPGSEQAHSKPLRPKAKQAASKSKQAAKRAKKSRTAKEQPLPKKRSARKVAAPKRAKKRSAGRPTTKARKRTAR